jgi:hypothetical protein
MPAPAAGRKCRSAAPLERHGKPRDQMPGIMLFNGFCEPTQAFVVAHGGNVARNIEGTKRIRGWRRISSHETRHDRAFWPIGSEWAARSITPVYDGIARARFQLPLPQGPKNATNRCSGRLSGPASSQRTAGDLVLCKPERLCYTLPAREPLFRLFLGSSAVEHSTVNRMVAGSNPARGASRGFYVLRADGLNPDSAA